MTNENGPLIEAESLTKRDGDQVLFAGATFSIRRWDRVHVTGDNSAALSAMMRVIAGQDSEYEGELRVADPDASVGYLPAIPDLPSDQDIGGVIDDLLAPHRKLDARYEAVMEALLKDPDGPASEELASMRGSAGAYDAVTSDLRVLGEILELPHPSTRVAQLTPAQRKRFALALLLVENHQLYVLEDLQLELSEDGLRRLSERIGSTTATWLMEVPDGALLTHRRLKQNGLVAHLANQHLQVSKRVTLSDCPSIRGQAVGADGQPLKSWIVVAAPATPTSASTLPLRIARTNREGRFDLQFPADGECRIELQSPKKVFANTVEGWWIGRRASCVAERARTGTHDLRLIRP